MFGQGGPNIQTLTNTGCFYNGCTGISNVAIPLKFGMQGFYSMLYPMSNLKCMHYVHKYTFCYHGNRKCAQNCEFSLRFILNPQTQRPYPCNFGKIGISICDLIKVTLNLLGFNGLCVLCSYSKHSLHTKIVKKPN